MEPQCAGRALGLVVDRRHHRRDVETDHQRPERIGDNRKGSMAWRRCTQDRHQDEHADCIGHGAPPMSGIDMPAEHKARDGANQCGKGERPAIGDKAFAQRKKQRDLPDEMIARANPAIRQEQLHARNCRPVRAGNMTPDDDVRRPQQWQRRQQHHCGAQAEHDARPERDRAQPVARGLAMPTTAAIASGTPISAPRVSWFPSAAK